MRLESEPRIRESPDVKTLDELIQRWIKEAKLQFNNQSTPSAAKVSDSPSPKKKILGMRVSKKVLDSNLRLLLQNKRPGPTHQAFSRQNDKSIPATIHSYTLLSLPV